MVGRLNLFARRRHQIRTWKIGLGHEASIQEQGDSRFLKGTFKARTSKVSSFINFLSSALAWLKNARAFQHFEGGRPIPSRAPLSRGIKLPSDQDRVVHDLISCR